MKSPNDRRPLRLMDTYRNLFYTPIYVAVAGGFLYEQGLDVHMSTVPTGRTSVELLKDGAVDIVQSGISRSLMDLDQGNEDAPVHIAEINQRDGFFLVGQRPTDGWRWADLEGARVIPVGFTPVPWMSLKSALKRQGVALDRVTRVEASTAEESIDLFKRGQADYVHLPNPHAQQLIEDGHGYLATAVGPVLGYVCYSSFAASPSYLADNGETVERFVSGFHRALGWVAATDADEVAATVASFFPDTPRSVLEESVRRYKDQETWPTDPLIGEDGFAAMRDLLIDGSLVKGRYPYDRLVRPAFALNAIQG